MENLNIFVFCLYARLYGILTNGFQFNCLGMVSHIFYLQKKYESREQPGSPFSIGNGKITTFIFTKLTENTTLNPT